MAIDYTNDLKAVGMAGSCADLCATGRKLGNIGVVRMQVLINDYCPYFGIKSQADSFTFDSNTFSALPKTIQARIRMPGDEVDGIHLREQYILRSNLMFVKASQPAPTSDEDQSSSNSTPPEPDKIVGRKHRIVTKLWNGTKSTEGNSYVPHYAWTHTGSLFDDSTVDPDIYEKGAKPSKGESNTSLVSNTATLAKWSYKTVNSPINRQYSMGGGTTTAGLPSEPEILFPEQSVVGSAGDANGMHWSCEKRRPVYQGADFFVILQRTASESTVQKNPRPLRDEYRFLDANLGNSAINPGSAVGSNGEVINAGVVELDETGTTIEQSRNVYDFNNQVYFIIEIGKDDPNHNYYIIIAENAKPTCVHVSNKVNQLIPNPNGTGYQAVTPAEKISRRLSTFEGATGDELLRQDECLITVRNHMGRLFVQFSGYEDSPWVIERKDLRSPISTSAGTTTSSPPASNVFQEATVPMVVPRSKLALHGGNVKVAFNWGYLKYESQVVIRMPQSLHIEGTSNAIPTPNDVNLVFQTTNKNLRVLNPENDLVYHQDALKVIEWRGAIASAKLSTSQPLAYTEFGKGAVPSTSPTRSNRASPETEDEYDFGSQSAATPEANMSMLKVSLVNGQLRNINPSENRAKAMDVAITMQAGHYTFPADPENTDAAPTTFINVMTPICTGYTLSVPPRGTEFNPTPVDVSHHVISFNETWSAQDYARVEHSGTLKFLINEGMDNLVAVPINATATNNAPQPAVNRSDFLAGLVDRGFYVRIKAWYQGSGVFKNQIGTNPNTYIFTGICLNGKITYEANKRILECQVFDLSKPLQEGLFLNSPYFDAVRDVVAVREIMSMVGFRETGNVPSTVAPASFLGNCVSRSSIDDVYEVFFADGDKSGFSYSSVWVQSFALPGSYDRLQSPMFRFKDGDRFMDAIIRMANISGKCVYFDRFGIMHYEDRLDQLIHNGKVSEAQVVSMAKESFYASPKMVGCDNLSKLAFNSYTWQRMGGEVYNQILVVSASPEGGLLVGGDKRYDSLDSPNSPGFLGFSRQLMQMSGVFGSEEAVKHAVETSTAAYIPTLSVSFEAMGRSYLKALDIITFTGIDPLHNNNGDPQPLRITNISTEITPEKNTWWSKIDAEWIYPGQGVSWAPPGN